MKDCKEVGKVPEEKPKRLILGFKYNEKVYGIKHNGDYGQLICVDNPY